MKSSGHLTFTRKPENDFREFISIYFRRCREASGLIEGNAGKWEFDDLIPGLSDFDTRLFVRDGATIQDWSAMSMAVGQVHLDLACRYERWARNLEHLPGINLTWSELLEPSHYSTEFSQWTFYDGDPLKLDQARKMARSHVWSDEDVKYHWKRIVAYYGRYDRTIDPAINLGQFENKYPLHSRLLHYFSPPLHSAVCLAGKKTTPGKIEAFRLAQSIFPNPETIDLVLRLIDGHYEFENYLSEPGMTRLEDLLENYLKAAVNVLIGEYALSDCPMNPSPAELKDATRHLFSVVGPNAIFETSRLARLMKGRLWFYTQKPSWFNSAPLIRNEFNRIRSNFLDNPWQIFVLMTTGKRLNVEDAIDETVKAGVIDVEGAQACRLFAKLADPRASDSLLFRRAAEIADMYDGFLSALEDLSETGKLAAMVHPSVS